MRSWPADVPPLPRSTSHTAVELSLIERVLDDVEARHTIPFGPSRPGGHEPEHWLGRLIGEFPGSTIIPKEQP